MIIVKYVIGFVAGVEVFIDKYGESLLVYLEQHDTHIVKLMNGHFTEIFSLKDYQLDLDEELK